MSQSIIKNIDFHNNMCRLNAKSYSKGLSYEYLDNSDFDSVSKGLFELMHSSKPSGTVKTLVASILVSWALQNNFSLGSIDKNNFTEIIIRVRKGYIDYREFKRWLINHLN